MAFKCPECGKRISDRDELFLHIETEHSELLPAGFSGARYIFLKNHGRDSSPCSECGRPTPWNEATQKPHKFCCERCKQIYRKKFEGRMIGKYNKVCLLTDPQQQIKMQQARKISGKYRWSDGKEIGYMGSYEKDFFQFIDVMLNFESLDVFSPAPQTFYYEYEGKKLFYIPDAYIASINTIVEIKDGGNNPNTHPKIQQVDKEKERLKDEVMRNQTQYNYVKITNKEYAKFVEFLIALKNQAFEDVKERSPSVIIREQLEVLKEQVTTDGDSNNLYILMYNNGVFNEYAALYNMELNNVIALEDGVPTKCTYSDVAADSGVCGDGQVYLFKYIKPIGPEIIPTGAFDSSEEFVNNILSMHGIEGGVTELIENTSSMTLVFSGDGETSDIMTILESCSKNTESEEVFRETLNALSALQSS